MPDVPHEKSAAEMARELLDAFVIGNRWIPVTPTVNQAMFLVDPRMEILFGGAAGGGKSIAMLAAALMFVDIPGYRALLLRRTFSDLSLPGALMDLSHQWLGKTAAKWNAQNHTWTFPSGATLGFGFLETETDKYRYAGSELAFIGFDELSQFLETQYLFLFSRLRQPKDSAFPLRMRAASNPGGVGHEWVKARFITPETKEDRVFIPSKLDDNPYLDAKQYDMALNKLDLVTRQQLRHGDWDISPESGLFRRAWFNRYTIEGGKYQLNRGPVKWAIGAKECLRFATLDVAATAKTTSDYSVMQVWDVTPDYDMLLVDQWRAQAEVPVVVAEVTKRYRAHGCTFIGIEWAHAGISVFQSCRNKGLTVRALKPKGDKVQRAQSMMIRAEAGQVFLPAGVKWVGGLLDELVSFPTAPHDDVVDAMSYAGQIVHKMGGAPLNTFDQQMHREIGDGIDQAAQLEDESARAELVLARRRIAEDEDFGWETICEG